MKRIVQRGLLLAALLIGMSFPLTAQSTIMTIYLSDGNERTYNMAEDCRVYFEGNEYLIVEIPVYNKGIRSDRYDLADIRKITCAETEDVGETTISSVYLSPNPVHDTFMLLNLNGRDTIQIYALDGRLVKTAEVVGDQPIDISDLSVGLYLVKAQSCTFKMIKL